MREATARNYELEELYGAAERSDGIRQLVRISGGIEIRPDIRRLNYGAITELRPIVLDSRPSRSSLTWRLPLDGWKMPNARDLNLPVKDDGKTPTGSEEDRKGRAGCSVLCQSVLLDPKTAADDNTRRFTGFPPPPPPPPPLRGVSMQMVVTEDSFETDHSGALQKQAEGLTKSRPSSKTLSWPASKK